MFVKRQLSVLVVALLLGPAMMTWTPPATIPADAAPTIDYGSYDYYVQNLSVFMEIQETGNVEFFEAINFSFNRGTYSMAYREIPHEGFEDLLNVQVTNSTGASLSIGGKYVFEWFQGKYIIRFPFLPIQAPANTTFFISYTVRGAAVSVSNDQLGVDWNIVGKGWTVPIKRLNVYIFMFSNITKSPLFDHYPDDANVTEDIFSKATLISFNRTNIPPGKTVRAIVYYPKNLEPMKSFERLMRENWWKIAAAIFLAAFFICLGFVVVRFASGRRIPRSLKPNLQIARDPVKLTTLIDGSYTPRAFFAGVVRLAQLGFIAIVDDRERGEIILRTREDGPDELTVPLLPYDIAIITALTEGPGHKPLHEVWYKVGRDTAELIHRELKNEGLFSRSGRYNIGPGAIAGGAIVAAVPSAIIYILAQYLTWYAVILGGLLLGIALAGVSVMVIMGFLVPRHTSRGAQERSQQAANLESIAYNLERLARESPDELPPTFDKSAAQLTAAPMPVKGGFPTFLRKLGAQAPDTRYRHPWYISTAAPENEAKGSTFGVFSSVFADTLVMIPLYFRGRTTERPSERPPVEGVGQDGEASNIPKPITDRPVTPPRKGGPKGKTPSK